MRCLSGEVGWRAWQSRFTSCDLTPLPVTSAQSSISLLTFSSASVFQPPPKPPFLSRKSLELKPSQTNFHGKVGKETSLPVTLSEWKLFQAVEAANRRKNLPWVRLKCETSLLAWHFKLLVLCKCFLSGHRAVDQAGDCCLALLLLPFPLRVAGLVFGQRSAISGWDSGVFVGQERADKVLSVDLEVRAVCEHKPFLVLCPLSLVPRVSMECCAFGELQGQLCNTLWTCPLLPVTSQTDPGVPLQALSCGMVVGPLVTWNVGLELWTGIRSSCSMV